jgi:acetate kinase
MNGLDCVVFTAGIGENNHDIRERALKDMSFYGIELDIEKNKQRGVVEISTENSRVKVLVIPTNEELVIASDTMKIVSELAN